MEQFHQWIIECQYPGPWVAGLDVFEFVIGKLNCSNFRKNGHKPVREVDLFLQDSILTV